ncbi:hypothetical protein ACHAW6_001017 [Cyclotella cf. meneghiniana]
MSLHEFCTDAGTHGRLKSDRAPKLVGCNSEFYKPAHKRYMDLTYAKPKHKNQIWCVDLEIQMCQEQDGMKECSKPHVGLCPHSPSQANPISALITLAGGFTRYEEVMGQTRDISESLDFDCWDLPAVHPSISEHDRRLGRWASVSLLGSDMCYWIIPATRKLVADITVHHVTWDDMADPTIKEMIDAFNNELTKNLDDSNFDNPDLIDFRLTDNLSLLNEHLCNRSPLDPAYGGNDTTPTDEDNAEPCECPEEDNIALDA